MSEISKHLGECIYRKRKEAKLTQAELAERTGVTEQTIRKIEHGEGNPQLDVLYSLITELGIDPAEIFYPATVAEGSSLRQLNILLSGCTDEQIAALFPIIKGALEVVNGKKKKAVLQ